MNFFAVIFAIAAISISSTKGKCPCSFKNYKPITSVNLLQTWITYQKYDNGPQKDAKCSFYEVSLNQTVPGSMVDWVTNIWQNNSKSCLKGDVTPTSEDLALINVRWTDSTEMPIAIVSSDNKNYLIARACYKYEGKRVITSLNFYLLFYRYFIEYVWIMSRTTEPSKNILDLIKNAIIEQELDESKLCRS